MLWSLVCFFFGNLWEAVDFADSWFAKIVDAFVIMSALLLAHKKLWHSKWKSWEEGVMKWAMYAFLVLFFVNAFVVIPYVRTAEANESKKTDDERVDELQKKLSDSESDRERLTEDLAASNGGADFRKLKKDFEDLKRHSLVDQGYSDPDEWIALTDSQITQWQTVLKPYKANFLMIQNSGKNTENLGESVLRAVKVISLKDGASMMQNYSDPGIEVTGAANDPLIPALQQMLKGIYPDVKLTLAGNSGDPYKEDDIIYINIGPKVKPPSSTPDKSTSPP
jgi:hypothetical protein